jgi:cytoplasmic iron level regulating protein YaaA (DUF328/UPF0246 family)
MHPSASRPPTLPSVLVLVPPSEGKSAPRGRGAPLDLDALSFPELTGVRGKVLDALVAASTRPDALALLGVGPSLAAEVDRNRHLAELPAVPASALYTGVLYDALGWPTLPAPARRRAVGRLLVVSALWGPLRPGDRVPPYRLSMDVDLPGTGPLAAFWRPHLAPVLEAAAGDGIVVDCRSATYAAAWRPAGALAQRTVTVRVLRERDGRRSVVSHMAKHTRGLVARHLLLRGGRDPRTPERLAAAIAEAFDCELLPPTRAGTPATLDVIVRD